MTLDEFLSWGAVGKIILLIAFLAICITLIRDNPR